MATWSRDKVDSSEINSGNEYTVNDQVSLESLNAMVNSGLYSQDVVERIGDVGDYSAGTTYLFPNIVRYATDGCGYMAIYKVGDDYTSFSNIAPTNSTYWKKIVDKGDQGIQGIQGVSISSIAKTSTNVLTDTYTITFSDATTTTFDVKNGKGISDIEKTSTTGLVDTYTITYNDTTTSTFDITNGNGIATIEKTSTDDNVDTYTITFVNGTTTTFNINNSLIQTINGKSEVDVILKTDDISDEDEINKFVTSEEKTAIANAVPNTRTVNSKALSDNITLDTDDLSDVGKTNKFATAEQLEQIATNTGDISTLNTNKVDLTPSGIQEITDSVIISTERAYTPILKLTSEALSTNFILERTKADESPATQTFLESGTSVGLIGTNSNHALRVRTNYIDRMTIDTGGRVGIGTTSPTEKLEVNGNAIISGNLNVNGDIIQNGSTYETHAEQLYSTKDEIILRDGAVAGLATGAMAKITAKLYDGTNDGVLGFDNNGVARVGDVGSEQAIATREDAPNDTSLAIWDDATNKFITNSDIKVVDNVLNTPADGIKIGNATLSYNSTLGSLEIAVV